ncbi:hypothetical protein AeNC1_017161, partial [Aphanomyces euteiches]
MHLKTPVPLDFFQCFPLTSPEISNYRQLGRQAVHDLMTQATLTGGQYEWSLHSTHGAIKVYRAENVENPVYCARTELEATLDDIVDIFLKTTTNEVRQVNEEFFPYILDTVRLYNITLPTPDAPAHYLNVSWDLMSSPTGGFLIKKRDTCFLEQQDIIEFEGRRAWVRVLTPVTLDACPNLEHTFGIVRGEHINCGVIYVETDQPGLLQVIDFRHYHMNGLLATGGTLGNFFSSMAMEGAYRPLVFAQEKIRAIKLCHASFLSTHALVPQHTRIKCAICLKKFGLLAKKASCQLCGEVVCRKPCSANWDLKISGVRVQVRLCTPCSATPPASSAPRRLESDLASTVVATESQVPSLWYSETTAHVSSTSSSRQHHEPPRTRRHNSVESSYERRSRSASSKESVSRHESSEPEPNPVLAGEMRGMSLEDGERRVHQAKNIDRQSPMFNSQVQTDKYAFDMKDRASRLESVDSASRTESHESSLLQQSHVQPQPMRRSSFVREDIFAEKATIPKQPVEPIQSPVAPIAPPAAPPSAPPAAPPAAPPSAPPAAPPSAPPAAPPSAPPAAP